MRPIKFRAWIDGQMSAWHEISFLPEAYNNDKDTCGDDEVDHIHMQDVFSSFEEQGVVMQQFTGLIDVNGKEIYEGDICKVMHGEHLIIAPMIWQPEKAQFGLDAVVDFEGEDHVVLTTRPEVIGNIFETPNLLK